MGKDFEHFASLRPDVTPADPGVIQRAREQLMTAIDMADRTDTEPATVTPLQGSDRPTRGGRHWKLAAAAVGIAAAFALGVVVAPGTPGIAPKPAAAEVLHDAAALQRDQPADAGTGSIRHTRFINLTDDGAPTYDRFVDAKGYPYDTSGSGAPTKEDYPDTVKTSDLEAIPHDSVGARAWLATTARAQDLSLPGEAPERGTYRLAIEVLTDPATPHAGKAAVLEAIAGFDVDAVRATNKGPGVDLAGREGTVLEFRFDEGYVDQLTIDTNTGAILSNITRDRDGNLSGGQVYLQENLVDHVG